ncbi:MAG: hypothetical protein ILP14_03380, partial [Oscillospiraceae bacterium]|nr:hypothetical protein [Oscillospiraceae bacterium]
RIEARKVYLNEKYAELEKGDEQVVIASTVTNFDTNDPDVEFGYFALANYKADGKDLIMLNCKGNVEILTYAKQEDGTFKVVESVVAEEGAGQDACIREMCDAFGVTLKDYNEHLDLMDYEEQGCLLDFLGEHPEYERIEYMGELKTKDDLEAMQDAFWEAYIAALGVGSVE